MIIVIFSVDIFSTMRAVALTVSATATFVLFLVTSLSSSAYAAQFSFDPSNGNALKHADYTLPAALIAIASLVGGLLIVLERKKARGIWFSNNERMR